MDPSALTSSFFSPEVSRLFSEEGVELLGVPIGSGSFVSSFASSLVAKLDAIDAKLRQVPCLQTQLCLLRGCLGFAKVNHLLRCCPPDQIALACRQFDTRLRRFLSRLLGLPAIPDEAWAQACLPLRFGGLGLTPASAVASSAHLGSLVASVGLSKILLGDLSSSFPSPSALSLLDGFWQAHAVSDDAQRSFEALGQIPKVQHFLSQFVWDFLLSDLRSKGPNDLRFLARLTTLHMPHAVAFIRGAPCPWLQLRASSPLAFRVALRRVLGLPLLESPASCALCGLPMDLFGDHAAVCAGSATKRHDRVRDLLFLVCKEAGYSVAKEVRNLLPGSRAKPGDLVIQSFSPSFACSAFDISLSDPLQSSKLKYAAVRKGYVGAQAESRKLHFSLQPCRRVGIEFVPLIWESFGGAMPRVLAFVEKVINFRCDRCPETALGGAWLRRHRMLVVHSQLSMAIHDQGALNVLKRLPPDAVSASSPLGNMSEAFSDGGTPSSSSSSSSPPCRVDDDVPSLSSSPVSPSPLSSSLPHAVDDPTASLSSFSLSPPSSSSPAVILETMDASSSHSSSLSVDDDDVSAVEGFYSSSLPTIV